MLVTQILKDKGDLVFTASPSETVAAAAASTTPALLPWGLPLLLTRPTIITATTSLSDIHGGGQAAVAVSQANELIDTTPFLAVNLPAAIAFASALSTASVTVEVPPGTYYVSSTVTTTFAEIATLSVVTTPAGCGGVPTCTNSNQTGALVQWQHMVPPLG